MKRNKLVSIAAITVALGVLATGCAGGSGSSKSDSKSSGGTKTVTVKAGTGANVKPYTYVGDDNETTGYDVEVLKELLYRTDQGNIACIRLCGCRDDGSRKDHRRTYIPLL